MIYNDDRPERIRGLAYLFALVLFVFYQAINAFVPNADSIVAIRMLAASVYSGVLYIYWKDALKAFVSAQPEKEDFLIAGIWLSFLSHNLQTIYAILYRLADAPKWLLNAEVVPLIVMISIIAGMFHVIAPGAYRGTVPPRERMALGVGVGIAVLLIGVLIATRPDIRPMMERVRPLIEDWWHTGQSGPVSTSAPA